MESQHATSAAPKRVPSKALPTTAAPVLIALGSAVLVLYAVARWVA